MTVLQWNTNEASNTTKASNGKKRLISSCHLKRDRLQREDDLQGASQEQYTQLKRFRTESPQSDTDTDSYASSSPSSQPAIDTDEQRARFNEAAASTRLNAEAKARRDHLCSLWMNVQRDVEMRDEADLSSPVNESNVFRLTVSTPTGHPHPYALGLPSSSRIKLDDNYFGYA